MGGQTLSARHHRVDQRGYAALHLGRQLGQGATTARAARRERGRWSADLPDPAKDARRFFQRRRKSRKPASLLGWQRRERNTQRRRKSTRAGNARLLHSTERHLAELLGHGR